MSLPSDRTNDVVLRIMQPTRRAWCGATLAAAWAGLQACAGIADGTPPTPEIGFLRIGPELRLRRMVARPMQSKGVVLFLHGFPETLHTWNDVTAILARDLEVHAFDWPGYGLSSRPPEDRFSYSPRDYANVLKAYIDKSGIDTGRLAIYATDIGALPALLLALDEPSIARSIVVGDFAPFNRPQYMHPRLQSLKSKPSSDITRSVMNQTADEILANAFTRGLPDDDPFQISRELKDDMARGWNAGTMTSADAFYHYYSHFTRDQEHLEANLHRLRTPVKVIWGEKDIYILPGMGVEFARQAGTKLDVLPGLGHYPHLQRPQRTADEVLALFDGR